MNSSFLKFIFIFLFFFFLAFPIRAANSLEVVINEVMWMGSSVSTADEWIELRNMNSKDIDLSGWIIENAKSGGENLVIPEGIILANSYFLIANNPLDKSFKKGESTLNVEPDLIGPGLSFKNEGNGNLVLKNKGGEVIDIAKGDSWPAGSNKDPKSSMERNDPPGEGTIESNWHTANISINFDPGSNEKGTPKAENSITEPICQPEGLTIYSGTDKGECQQGIMECIDGQMVETQPEIGPTNEVCDGIDNDCDGQIDEEGVCEIAESEPELEPITYPSDIFINEFLPNPEGPDAEEEWIEIFNQNSFEVDLSNWRISDIIGKTKTYSFPKGIIISPKGFLVLSRLTSKITLNNDKDGLNLIQPDGKILDSINYEKAPQGQSYNRIESGWMWSNTLTPGSVNIIPIPPKEEKTETNPQEVKEPQAKKGLAAIGEQIPKSSKSLFILLTAFGVAIFSGIIILILKKKIKNI